MVQNDVSEDCLYLNVWAPEGPRVGLPVLMWIHVGGFTEGSGSVPIYNGAHLAARGIIVVTVNYRLGVLGFLAHPDLERESTGAPPTNFGLQDQIAALKWIRNNIRAFGGDPSAVTIAGQSAGSISVHALVASPLASGLFRGAIGESGLPNQIPLPTLAEAEQEGVEFARAKNLRSIEELRSTPLDALGADPGGGLLRFMPAIDGTLLDRQPLEMIASGVFNDVPMMIGNVADEGSSAPGYASADAEAFRSSFARFGRLSDRFSALYPAATDAQRVEAGRILGQDRMSAALVQWSADRLAKGRAAVYAYMFAHVLPGPESARFRVFHTSEVPYVFANLGLAPERHFTVMDTSVSGTMSSYWINFVKAGDPNGPGLATWPRLSADAPQILVIGDRPVTRPPLSPAKRSAYGDYEKAGGKLAWF
jgi:para-nitrobenzyl esterase